MSETSLYRQTRAWGSSRQRTVYIPQAVWLLTAFVIVLALILGGGARQGRWSDALVQLASLTLIVTLVFQAPRHTWRDVDRFAIALVGAVLLLPLLQLVRMPPALWTALPGREGIALAYDIVGADLPWLPVSLDPASTWRSWLGLLPAVAVFFATIATDNRGRRSLSLVIIAIGLVSVLLGLAQLMQGQASPLRFYPFTNTGDSVGFFASRNQYASLLTIMIPLVTAWAIGVVHDRRVDRVFGLAVCLIIFAVLLLGIGIARSRAGVALALFAAVASFFLIPSGGERRVARFSLTAIAAAAAVGIILAVHFAFFRVLGRFETDILDDLRFTIAEVTASAIWVYFPIGTGFGTFEEIYRIFEPREALLSAYINHAHNDWLEALLEGGVLAGALMICFLVWFVSRGVRVWRTPAVREHVLDQVLVRAATIALVLLLLFSLAEYPLRTTALSVVFAWLAGLMIEPLPTSGENANRTTVRDDSDTIWRMPHPHRRRRTTRRRVD